MFTLALETGPAWLLMGEFEQFWPGFDSINVCLTKPDCAGPNWASMVCIAGPAWFSSVLAWHGLILARHGLVLAWHGLVQFAV